MIDWQAIGAAAAAIFIGVGGWLTGRRGSTAKTDTEVAKARAEGAQAAAEQTVVELMREEVSRLSVRVAALESREGKLIRHIYRLEGLMRGAGIEPPHFDIDDEPIKAGGTE